MPADLSLIKDLRYKPDAPTDAELAAMELISTEDYSVYTQKLSMACQEGKEVLIRLGISELLQSGDVAHGFYTASGDFVYGELGTFLHMITATVPIKYVLKHYADDPSVGIRDGDVFFCNEAIYGGLHNPDQIVYLPVFWRGELVAWVMSGGHEPETGAIEPGGQPAGATDRFAEGLKVPPLKIGEDFKLKRDILDFFENMVRFPEMITTDTAAKLAACLRLRARLLEMIEAKEKEFVIGLLRKIIQDSAAAAKERVRRLPDGVFRTVSFGDTAGPGETLLRVPCTIVKRGDSLLVDFAGASPEVPGPFNAFEHMIYSHLVCMLFQYYFGSLPPSAGTLVPFDVRCPDGSMLDASPHAAISSGTALGPLPGNAFMMCLNKVMFASGDEDVKRDIALPPGAGTRSFFFGGVDQSGREIAGLSNRTINTAGLGARPHEDGVDAGSFWWGGIGNATDVEHEEALVPYMALYASIAPDNGGPGKFRGGAGQSWGVILHHTPAFYVQTFGLQSRFPATSGLFGGYAPGVRPAIRIRGGDWERFNGNGATEPPRNEIDLMRLGDALGAEVEIVPVQGPGAMFKEGDVIAVVGSAAAGYGDVLERDPELVARDVGRGITTRWAAERVYCVALGDDGTVDEEATEERRAAERRRRLEEAKPYDEFMAEWSERKPPESALELYGEWPAPEGSEVTLEAEPAHVAG
jgi:N-methylhydantoinase B/oxoprolinase/acetone carboxylase alpha subunit